MWAVRFIDINGILYVHMFWGEAKHYFYTGHAHTCRTRSSDILWEELDSELCEQLRPLSEVKGSAEVDVTEGKRVWLFPLPYSVLTLNDAVSDNGFESKNQDNIPRFFTLWNIKLLIEPNKKMNVFCWKKSPWHLLQAESWPRRCSNFLTLQNITLCGYDLLQSAVSFFKWTGNKTGKMLVYIKDSSLKCLSHGRKMLDIV